MRVRLWEDATVEHPISEASLRNFLAGTASREETRDLVVHLLKGCPSCSEKLRTIAREEIPGEAYENILDRLEKNLAATLDLPVAVDWYPSRRTPRGGGVHRFPGGSRRDPPERLEVRA
jgi:hypothetical protein